jgi:hypothetical protein
MEYEVGTTISVDVLEVAASVSLYGPIWSKRD